MLDITDPGFQDFRQDATCLIRPQSLIGEKFVDCRPTLPRAPGSEPPPPLEQIADGETGDGPVPAAAREQRQGRRPRPDQQHQAAALRGALPPDPQRPRRRPRGARRRAGRDRRTGESGPDARPTTCSRSSPPRTGSWRSWRPTPTSSSPPLARDRESLTGFIRSAGETAAATAERGAELEENLQKLPPTLRQVRLTMRELGNFSDAAFPTVKVLGDNAASITAATRALGPFADATHLRAEGPRRQRPRRPGRPCAPPTRSWCRSATWPDAPRGRRRTSNRLTSSLRRTGGFENLMKFIYNTTGAFNGFDQYGHYQRTNILVSSLHRVRDVPLVRAASPTSPGRGRSSAATRSRARRSGRRSASHNPGPEERGRRPKAACFRAWETCSRPAQPSRSRAIPTGPASSEAA